MRPLDVLSYGEALIDFLPQRTGVRLREVEHFRRVAGGAPANCAVGLARLGVRVGMLGKLGADEFGFFLRDSLEIEGIDTAAMRMTREAKTGVTFVTLDADGERSFFTLSERSADLSIRPDDIDVLAPARAHVFLYGSNLMVDEQVRAASWRALDAAREAGCFLVSDPNLRLHLWRDHHEAKLEVVRSIEGADLVKLSEEELDFLAPGLEPLEAWEQVFAPMGIGALVHTMSSEGAELYMAETHVRVPAPAGATIVDTTGAGDGFIAGLLTGLVRLGRQQGLSGEGAAAYGALLRVLSEEDWERVLKLGCFVGTRVCAELGATPALPRAADVPWSYLGWEEPRLDES